MNFKEKRYREGGDRHRDRSSRRLSENAFHPILRYFHKNNARNITYIAVHIFPKNLDLRKNAYSRTTSWCGSNVK